jgi:amino acid transporter
MAEEVANASRAIPRAIMLSIAINGTLGFGMLIAVLFCMGDLDAALNSPTGYPYIEIFYQATNSLSGSLTMVSINLIIAVCSVIGMLAATSRQFWSFARDRGIPGWRWWSHVSGHTEYLFVENRINGDYRFLTDIYQLTPFT